MLSIRYDIASSTYTMNTLLDSRKVKSDKYIDGISYRRSIIRDIKIEPVCPSFDTRLILEISEDMIPKMSNHISDNIGKRVDPKTSCSGDAKCKMHSISVQKNPRHYGENEGEVKVKL